MTNVADLYLSIVTISISHQCYTSMNGDVTLEGCNLWFRLDLSFFKSVKSMNFFHSAGLIIK